MKGIPRLSNPVSRRGRGSALYSIEVHSKQRAAGRPAAGRPAFSRYLQSDRSQKLLKGFGGSFSPKSSPDKKLFPLHAREDVHIAQTVVTNGAVYRVGKPFKLVIGGRDTAGRDRVGDQTADIFDGG